MTITEKLMQANGLATIKRKPDAERIQELEAENTDLKARLEDTESALVELADIITAGE